jgi:hypothetical protein
MIKINVLLATLSASFFAVTAQAQEAPRMDLSTEAMVSVCKNTEDPASQNFCFGFGEGVYQGYLIGLDPKAPKTICVPKDTITREQVLKDFLQWVQSNPQFNKEYAAGSIMKFLPTRFPCKN